MDLCKESMADPFSLKGKFKRKNPRQSIGNKRNENNAGRRGKYFKKLDRQGKMVSDQDKRRNTTKGRLLARIERMQSRQSMVVSAEEWEVLNNSGERSIDLKSGEKKGLNSKIHGVTVEKSRDGRVKLTRE